MDFEPQLPSGRIRWRSRTWVITSCKQCRSKSFGSSTPKSVRSWPQKPKLERLRSKNSWKHSPAISEARLKIYRSLGHIRPFFRSSEILSFLLKHGLDVESNLVGSWMCSLAECRWTIVEYSDMPASELQTWIQQDI